MTGPFSPGIGYRYNGTPRGLTNCNEGRHSLAYSIKACFGLANICKGGCARCNGKAKSGEALDECLCLHAEENALLEVGRERVGDGAVLFCNTYVINSLQKIFVITDT
jgi:dCMP deaminase